MDRDRRLAEMMGICVNWEPDASVYAYGVCKNCGDRFFNHFAAPDFSTPEWRARLKDFAIDDSQHPDWKWKEFWKWVWFNKNTYPGDKPINEDWDFDAYLWRNLPSLLAEYHGEGR